MARNDDRAVAVELYVTYIDPGWQPAADRGRPSPLRCIPWSGGLLRGTGVRLPERGAGSGGAEQERLPRGAAPNVRPARDPSANTAFNKALDSARDKVVRRRGLDFYVV